MATKIVKKINQPELNKISGAIEELRHCEAALLAAVAVSR